MNKKTTIIYGGAFNPPTLAHEMILKRLVEYAHQNMAEVWLLPSGNRNDKIIGAQKNHRLEYLGAMIESCGEASVHICEVELDRPCDIETYDTVVYLNKKYQDRQFVWVFGCDSINTMETWKNGEWLLDNLVMLAIQRNGDKCDKLGRNISWLNIKTPDVSSTIVRRNIKNRLPLDGLVSKSVEKVITKHLAC